MAEYIEAAAAAVEIIDAISDTAKKLDEVKDTIANAYDSLSVSVRKIFGTYVAMYEPAEVYANLRSFPWIHERTFVSYLTRIVQIDYYNKDARKRISGMLLEMASVNELASLERFPDVITLICPFREPFLQHMIDLHYALSLPSSTSNAEFDKYSVVFYKSIETLLALASTEGFTREKFEDKNKLIYK